MRSDWGLKRPIDFFHARNKTGGSKLIGWLKLRVANQFRAKIDWQMSSQWGANKCDRWNGVAVARIRWQRRSNNNHSWSKSRAFFLHACTEGRNGRKKQAGMKGKCIALWQTTLVYVRLSVSTCLLCRVILKGGHLRRFGFPTDTAITLPKRALLPKKRSRLKL